MVIIDSLPSFILRKDPGNKNATKKQGHDLLDPGTINSDEEVEDYSADEEMDLVEPTHTSDNDLMRISKSWGKEDVSKETNQAANVDYSEAIEKYGAVRKKKKGFDVCGTINRVRNEEKEKRKAEKRARLDSGELSEDSDLLSDDDEFVTPTTEKEDAVVARKEEQKFKEAKRKRIEKVRQDRITQEDEKYKFTTKTVSESAIDFQEMNLSFPLLEAIKNMKYEKPTPIQAEAIPYALLGRDICGCAATGTGKTAAYMLPILERLLHRATKDVTRVLVLVPTRELGVQVYQVSQELAKYTDIHIALSIGGLSQEIQSAELGNFPDIIIATPGRLLEHLAHTPRFHLKEIEILVLDEADRILDEYFLAQLKEVVNSCCPKRQTMLFSATMTKEVKDLAVLSLSKPLRIFVNSNTDVAQNLKQEFIKLKEDEREHRRAILAALVCRNFKQNCLVFAGTKAECHEVFILLGLLGINAGELHGNLSQVERLEALQKFRNKETDVLVATDVASRGLDIVGVQTVINYSLPVTYQHYIHRVGRTARSGFAGRSITLAYTKGKDYALLRAIRKHSLTPMYSRIIASEVVMKYAKKVEKMKAALKSVLREEKTKKELDEALKSIKQIHKKVDEVNALARARKKIPAEALSTVDEIRREKWLVKQHIAGLTETRLTAGMAKKICAGRMTLSLVDEAIPGKKRKWNKMKETPEEKATRREREEALRNMKLSSMKGKKLGKLHKRQMKRGEIPQDVPSGSKTKHKRKSGRGGISAGSSTDEQGASQKKLSALTMQWFKASVQQGAIRSSQKKTFDHLRNRGREKERFQSKNCYNKKQFQNKK